MPSQLFHSIKKTIANYKILSIDHGQFASMMFKSPINKDKQSLPWYTYPAIDFLSTLDFSNSKVFEYGSGNSTIYWATKSLNVIAVENDQAWHGRVSESLPQNVKLILEKDTSSYPESIHKISKKFDVVIIDGVMRYQCAQEALSKLKKNGITILDNSDWHQTTSAFLRNKGFIQIDFFGFVPINDYKWCTSFFLQNQSKLMRLPASKLENISGTIEQVETNN